MDCQDDKLVPAGKFRRYLPDLSQGKFKNLPSHDARSWKEDACRDQFIEQLLGGWLNLREQPFRGITSDGNLISDLYRYEDDSIDTQTIAAAAGVVLDVCTDSELKAIRQPLNSRTWRSWSNPEIYFSEYGVRLEEVSESLTQAVLQLIELSLSPEGFQKFQNARRMNHFLGKLCNAHGVLNDLSYNFQIFGEPSAEGAWGWSIYGHHLCMNTFLDRKHIHIGPVFIGAEPNEIDQGLHAGTTLMRKEEELGLRLMQELSCDLRDKAQIYSEMRSTSMPAGRYNRADQRHLCGAFQDNRVVPYEGIRVTEMNADQIDLVFDILHEFLIYLPQTARQNRLAQIRRFIKDTFLSWIGGYSISSPFYFRIQSPVVVVEFDHHAGVFLGNKEPEKFHIHTICRAPNGGDYGNMLRAESDRLA